MKGHLADIDVTQWPFMFFDNSLVSHARFIAISRIDVLSLKGVMLVIASITICSPWRPESLCNQLSANY